MPPAGVCASLKRRWRGAPPPSISAAGGGSPKAAGCKPGRGLLSPDPTHSPTSVQKQAPRSVAVS